MPSSLGVEPGALADAGRSVIGHAQDAAAPTGGITGPANDPVSVQAAHHFASLIAALAARTQSINSATNAAGVMTQASANTYETQEALNRGTLAIGGDAGYSLTPPRLQDTSKVAAPAISAPRLGAPPTSGREIAELVHGGPGVGSLISASDRLQLHAANLSSAADGVGADATLMAAVWQSHAADQADARMTQLVSRYTANSDAATKLSRAISAQADDFAALRRSVPTVKDFDDTQRKLRVAYESARINPIYAPAAAKLAGDLTELNRRATTAYAEYTTRTAENTAAAADDNLIEAVDFKLAPPGDDPEDVGGPDDPVGNESEEKPNPKDPHPTDPNRSADGTYGPGNSGDGKAAEKAALDAREERTHIPLERTQVRATHPDVINPKTKKPQHRYYDALEPTGNPNEYVGIEAKTHEGAHRRDQERFDAAVSADRPATATLNGREITIVDTDIEYPPEGWVPPSAQDGGDTPASGDAAPPSPSSPPPPALATTGMPPAGAAPATPAPTEAAPETASFPEWGTQLTPQQMIDSGDPALRVIGQEIRRRMAEQGKIDPSGIA